MAENRPFGDFLRSRRTRLPPDTIAGATRQRRRTPGLKREEVAQRAGISAEWYVKLEQGRSVSPSAETVEALGRALLLDKVELAHLRSLAAAGGRQPFRLEETPDVLRRIVSSLLEPAYVTGQRFDVLTWNGAAAALFGDFGQVGAEDRNILHWMLTDPAARRVFGGTWAEEARRVVSLFRAAHDLWARRHGLRRPRGPGPRELPGVRRLVVRTRDRRTGIRHQVPAPSSARRRPLRVCELSGQRRPSAQAGPLHAALRSLWTIRRPGSKDAGRTI